MIVAALLVVADCVMVVSLSSFGFNVEAVVFIFFAIIHIDYVRITRGELKTKWYLKDMENL